MADLSLSIGSIYGIKIELNALFLLLSILILYLSAYLFVIWVLLFACVLVHELVHSITSKWDGVKVKKIVLYPLGGGSIIDTTGLKPEIEFKISIVGPIASLLLAMLFGIANIYAPAGMVRTTLQMLFILNLFLGVFNLLPWLPLDGGRALRSYLQRKRSFLDATRIAFKASNVVTVLFVVGTVIYAAVSPNFSFAYREFLVLFDVVIAFIIYSGAQSELQAAIIKEGISDLRAKDAATRNYTLLKSNTKVGELYRKILKGNAHTVLFIKGGKTEVFSNALLQKAPKTRLADLTIGDLGVVIPTMDETAPLYDAIEKMKLEESGIAAVTRRNKICGILLMQHIESIVALRMSQKKRTSTKE